MIEKIEVISGDITRQNVDAIVNAANNALLGGGGVDGAIHRAAGPELLQECKNLKGCKTGEAKITRGYRLPAKWIIHVVGPVWRGGNNNEDNLLEACYQNALSLAVQNGIKTIAFPSISTGAYGFPIERASKIAITQIKKFLESDKTIEKVLIVCFGEYTLKQYSLALQNPGYSESHLF